MTKLLRLIPLCLLVQAATVYGQSPAGSGKIDTTCYPREDAINLTKKALLSSVYKEQRDSLQSSLTTLNKLIEIKQLQINNLIAQTDDYKKLISGYDSQIKTMREQRDLIESQVFNLNKLYIKEKRRKTFFKILILPAIAGGIYLGTKL